ncbi:M56 family metallopeptidase [Gramella sp. AN32]|uniref:M56 family metallopeptidase n=1 Tax=Christiangramia antarctica TaxID=2058158 RepID=A0ABW5X8M7_9FLAO|nr:M56 family metallopeptidase [Gramella sp. AN32]MCM4157850.1 hypothetical protein [Gramella sp. AN32]
MMESFLIYIAKSAAVIPLFYIGYIVLLRRDNNFYLNRKFLLSGIFTSAILPAIYFTRKVIVEIPVIISPSAPLNMTETPVHTEDPVNWLTIFGYAFLVVSAVFLFRFLLQLQSVFKMILRNKVEKTDGLSYINLKGDNLPFSFFKFIAFNPENHSEKDLQLIIQHEKIHARQYHSVDILLANFATCLLWWNPFIWLYKKEIEHNLEFIADSEAVKDISKIEDYQRALVKVSVADLRPALTNHFYQSFIKKRIIMLNTKNKRKNTSWKIILLAPCILAFMLMFNVKTEAQVKSQTLENSPEVTGQVPTTSITVTSQTSEKSLKRLSKLILNDGVDLNFKDVVYENGKIIAIKSNFADPVRGVTGSYNQANDNGIQSFKFYKDENGQMGYKTLDEAKLKTTGTGHTSTKQGDQNSKSSTTQENSVTTSSMTFSTNEKDEIQKTLSEEKIFENLGNINASQNDSLVRVGPHKDNPEPLFVIDGEIQKDKPDMDKINEDNIARINVKKGEEALEKYGEKGRNGVVEIYTKEYSGELEPLGKPQFIVWSLRTAKSEKDLHEFKTKVENELGVKLQFSEIKNNAAGNISQIKVTASKGKTSATSTFSNDQGLSTIGVSVDAEGKISIMNKS